MARKGPPRGQRLSRAEARRLALAAQGFDRPRPRRPGAAEVAATIRRLGLLQLDFVNVLVPAHYLVLFSRLGPYDRSLLDEVVYRRREFTEQWTQVREASALAELARAEELQQRAARIDDQIARLLEPLEDELSTLVLERDRLFHEALAARLKFFQAARKADPSLGTHRGLCYARKGELVSVVWDDAGPQFSDADGAEPPQLQPFQQRRPGRLELLFRSRPREGT